MIQIGSGYGTVFRIRIRPDNKVGSNRIHNTGQINIEGKKTSHLVDFLATCGR